MRTQAQIHEALKKGATVITPNNRLSQQLLRDTMRMCKVEDKPRCLPYRTFIQEEFKHVQFQYADVLHPTLLTLHEERLLWQKIIREATEYAYTDGLMTEIHRAWTHCMSWQIDMESGTFSLTPQTELFQKLHRIFKKKLSAIKAITEVELVPYLLRYPRLREKTLIIWLSFDEYTPMQRTLQRALAEEGDEIVHEDLLPQEHVTYLYKAKDTRDETDQMIAWLLEVLTQKKERIGVIVPNLNVNAGTLHRRLRQSLPPHQFEISLGQPLTAHPLIATALSFLALNQTLLRHQDIRLLLNSPYITGQIEWDLRVQLLDRHVLMQEEQVPYDAFIAILNDTTPLLANTLKTLSPYPKETSPYEWGLLFKSRLNAMGFPGEMPLTSELFQTMQKFDEVLDAFQKMGHVQALMTEIEAISCLYDLLKNTVFQIQKAPSPIQIMGLLEASGLTFDCVWIMGLTDECLPQKTKLSPFIPIALQRAHRMPRALLEKEKELAEKYVWRLQQSAPLSIFSYSVGDTSNLPSPCLGDYPLLQPLMLSDRITPSLEMYVETYLHPYTEKTVQGGSSMLANQAKCPFRAFAAHRLHAQKSIQLSTGLNDAERGQIIHLVLERIWQILKNQKTLIEMPNATLNALLLKIIDKALAPYQRYSLGPLIKVIEKERLFKLVSESFIFEKARPAFVVKALETQYTMALAELEFRVRIDRLDQLMDQSAWIIDYKSSLPLPKPWFDERPEAPQLLLYALLNEDINALLFFQLKKGQVTVSGLSEEEYAPLKQEPEWKALRANWKERLTALAQEFRQGECQPTPKRESICLQCEFQSLCRVD